MSFYEESKHSWVPFSDSRSLNFKIRDLPPLNSRVAVWYTFRLKSIHGLDLEVDNYTGQRPSIPMSDLHTLRKTVHQATKIKPRML